MKPLDPAQRALLDAANRERTPDAETRARVLASVLALGAAGAAGSAKAASTAAASGGMKAGSGLGHWLLLSGLGVVGLSCVYLLIRHPRPADEARSAVVAASVSAVDSAAAQPASERDAQAAPSASSSGSTAPTDLGKAPGNPLPVGHTPSSGNALERELSLLQSAHRAYRAGQASKALQLAREHAQLFPRSQLVAERETIEVLSLCALGRTREARTIAANLRAASGSPSLAGLDASCVGK